MAHSAILPAAYKTVGAMIEAKVSIIAMCQKCDLAFKVDLAAIACVKGMDYCLVGKHPVCRIGGCEQKCIFVVSMSKGSPRITLDRWAGELAPR